MKIFNLLILSFGLCLLSACIKDDFVEDRVDPVLRITTTVDTIEIDTDFQFEEMYLNLIGQEEEVTATWKSADASIISIDDSGLATALMMGSTIISVEYDDGATILTAAMTVVVGQSTVISNPSTSGSIATTSSYDLQGDFEYKETATGVELIFADNYEASTALPGLYIYLSNNRNSVANALEISAVEVFNGAHEYSIEGVGFNDFQYILYFCKPFNVKVGDGEL